MVEVRPSTDYWGSDLKYFERFITVSIVYWIVNILIEMLGRHIERQLDIETPVAIDLPDLEVRSTYILNYREDLFQVKRF